MQKTTTIKIKENERDFIAKAAKRFHKSMGEFAYQCVLFVDTFRYNPYDLASGHAQEEFKKLKSQLISFIRKQEADHIKPMTQGMVEVRKELLEVRGTLQQLVVNTAEPELERSEQTKPIEAIRDTRYSDLMTALQEKDSLLNVKIAALKELKRSAMPGKREVVLQMTPERFEELVRT